MHNPLLVIKSLGQSIWLDYIERGMLVSGELIHLIERDGLAGITSNPSIFEKAITSHEDYEADIACARLVHQIYIPGEASARWLPAPPRAPAPVMGQHRDQGPGLQ